MNNFQKRKNLRAALENQRSRLKSNGKVNDSMTATRRTVGNKMAGSNIRTANNTEENLATLMPGNMMEMQSAQYHPPDGVTGLFSANRRSKLTRGTSVDMTDPLQQQPAVVCGRPGLYVDFSV